MLKVQGNWFRKFGDWMSWIAIDFAFSEHYECRSNDGDLSIGAAGVLKLCDEIGKGKVMTFMALGYHDLFHFVAVVVGC